MKGVSVEWGSSDPDIVYPWMRVVAIRNSLKESVVLRVWQLYTGSITNLRAKPGTTAAEFVSPNGILTEKGSLLIEELNMERSNYLMQTKEQA